MPPQIAMMALDLQPGDEVITPSFTFVATVEVVALLGLKPIFAEVLPGHLQHGPDDVRRKITPRNEGHRARALFGQTADMGAMMAGAREHGPGAIEDNCQAVGSDYTLPDGGVRKAGTIGDIGTTSFFPSKNLGCYGDGGAIFTNDDELANGSAGVQPRQRGALLPRCGGGEQPAGQHPGRRAAHQAAAPGRLHPGAAGSGGIR